ncbi:MAG: Antilisterial bacteriocin subtilosin biosynthesis protein AlbA [Candidatus Heimdallarchaeota archaeon LC_3]|nr:MAG: Antilisterial bacteriocin subtilosin biosynthesis protein AlbA [Candidatus Heimdallarchaeota archaeon LC_3]
MTIALQSSKLEQKNVYSVPFLADQHQEFVLWFFTGSRCNLECTHCYVESSPTANQHPYLTFETFWKYLDEALKRKDKQLEIYFTGGEPFINPEITKMLKKSLEFANTTVLTNAIRITKKLAKKLQVIQANSKNILTFRVSLDGPSEETNDLIRGANSFKNANKGLKNLVEAGFNPIITAMKSWSNNNNNDVNSQYVELVEDIGIPQGQSRLKLLPPILIGNEEKRNRSYNETEMFTEGCFIDYNYNNLQCSKCRMVSENGVWVCPILINDDEARMGDTIKEASKPYEMKQMACWTCRMSGLNCEN